MSENAFPEFPADLIADQYALHQARYELSTHCQSLPAWDQVRDLPEAEDEWGPDQPPLGQTRAQFERTRELRERVVELAARVHGHSFWLSLSGRALVEARDGLKRAEGAVPAYGDSDEGV